MEQQSQFSQSQAQFNKRKKLEKPTKQEKLFINEELNQRVQRQLSTNDSVRPKIEVEWSYKELKFVKNYKPKETFTTFHLDSEYLFKDTDEYKEFNGKFVPEGKSHSKSHLAKKGSFSSSYSNFSDINSEKVHNVDTDNESILSKTTSLNETSRVKANLNKSSENLENEKVDLSKYISRETQTETFDFLDSDSQSAQIILNNYRGLCNKLIILEAFKNQELAGSKGNNKEKKLSVMERHTMEIEDSILSSEQALKLAERLMNQNFYEDICDDFAYYIDPSDEFREEGDGTLLPLWKFLENFPIARKMHITDICWSTKYPQLFGATFGSFNFLNPAQNGIVALMSLKNSTYPEYFYTTESGAMTLDIHYNTCSLAIGLIDGNVLALEIKLADNNSIETIVYKNNPTEMKHLGSVWNVKWKPSSMDSFYSVGNDGKLFEWTLTNSILKDNEKILIGREISTLYLPRSQIQGVDGLNFKPFGCARVLSIHPILKHIYLIGTAEGKIFLGNGSKFEKIYNAHFLPVSSLDWNHFHEGVFLSGSDDWTIKIWRQTDNNPIYTFEIGVAVFDASWAPYSSSIFAAVTEEGKALVYDLNINRDRPLCHQQIVTKKRFHPFRIRFNPIYPILLAGDDRGLLFALKLSPNLQNTDEVHIETTEKLTKEELKEEEKKAKMNYETEKLNRILGLMRDHTNKRNMQGEFPGVRDTNEVIYNFKSMKNKREIGQGDGGDLIAQLPRLPKSDNSSSKERNDEDDSSSKSKIEDTPKSETNDTQLSSSNIVDEESPSESKKTKKSNKKASKSSMTKPEDSAEDIEHVIINPEPQKSEDTNLDATSLQFPNQISEANVNQTVSESKLNVQKKTDTSEISENDDDKKKEKRRSWSQVLKKER